MSAWLANHFFNPGFVAGGALLVALPIAIHLINRVQYRRVRFAAMEFLLQSQKRNQRRLLLEQLLLLLLRILIVIGLVLLISRLILNPAQMSIFRGAQTHHLVLIDDSLSMKERWEDTSGFEQAIKVVNQIAAGGAQQPNTQKLTLLRLSQPEQPFFVERNVNEDFVAELLAKLDPQTFKCTNQSLDLTTGLLEAKKFFAEDNGNIHHLHVISDFRERDWRDQKAITSAIEGLAENGVSVNLVRAVPEAHANLTVVELTGDIQVAAVDVPLRMRVTVKNNGSQVASNVRLSVSDNNNKLPTSVLLEKIEPQTEVTQEFEIRLATPSTHKIRVSLDSDALSEDNDRSIAVDVPQAVSVLLVDGDSSGDAASYIADAIAADPKATGYLATIESVEALRRRPLDGFACIYLINVPELPADSIDALERYVADGGGLAWFVGESIRPAHYNSELYRNGTGLFPIPLESAPKELILDPTSPGADILTSKHPLFRIFAGEDNALVKLVRIFQFMPAAKDWVRDDQVRMDRVQTMASLRSKDSLFLEHRFGKGRVITCLTTAQPDWNNWATDNSFVVVQLELVKSLARTDRIPEQRQVGEPIVLALDPAEYSDSVEIETPGEEGDRMTRLQASPESAGETGGQGQSEDGTLTQGIEAPVANDGSLNLRAVFRNTDQPGVYTVRLLKQSQASEERLIAFNTAPGEGELALATSADLRKRMGNASGATIQEFGRLDWVEGREAGSEIRQWLLWLLGTLFVLEQALAYKLSYHPPQAVKTLKFSE
ncbi:BatA domain-containing protein [Schlesneria sp. T3-172]|uniref:BatA domain-containing protein n=1 Tax=Schlesneria sphaerica TaxID=3373610 RepID=UPI0037C56D82